MTETKEFQTIIIGAGPAGLTAAIYLARAGLSILVIGSPYESQVAKLGLIENYPGYARGIQGLELIEAMEKQTKANGSKIISSNVISIEKNQNTFLLKTEEDEIYRTKTVILAMGAQHRKMRIPGEEEFFSKGVSYCTVCDGALYQGKPTAVLGYGNGALKAVLYLSNLSSKVYLICTKKTLEAEAIYENRLKSKDNIEVYYNSRVTKISGKEFVESVTFKDETQKEKELKLEGVFIEYGSVPNSLIAKQLGVKIDENGFIIADIRTGETNIPGVFAAGDVCGRIRQIATAVGDGCTVAAYAQNFIEQKKV